MENERNKFKLQKELIKFHAEIVNNNINISLIETYEELKELLNYINKDNQTLLFYLNRIKIQEILDKEDKIVDIDEENINNISLKSLFYLSLAILNDSYVINYSYKKDVIMNLYNNIKKEGKNYKKLLLYIIFNILLNNYEQLDTSDDSLTDGEIDEIKNEIKNFLNEQLLILKKSDLFLNKKEDDLLDIENTYSGILIWLIKNRKFEDYKYVEDIMVQLDLENIELTNNMFKEIKKEFDENSKKDYIDNYKIKKFESLNNEKIVNFNFLMLNYVFKNNIYIYNIDFLLESKKNIHNLLNEDYVSFKNLIISNVHEPNQNFDKKKVFILKRFLDSEYYYDSGNELKKLYEVLEYYKHYNFDEKNKIKEIVEEIENIKQKRAEKNTEKYLKDYKEAKKMNIRYELLKYIYDGLNKGKEITQDSFSKEIVKPWKSIIEMFIRDKKVHFSKIKSQETLKLILKLFSDENNRETVLKIFTQEQVDAFIKNYNEYKFLKEVFNLNEDVMKKEEEKKKILNEWERIKNMLQENKFDIKDENIKNKLFNYFNCKENQENHCHILNEESYNFLLEKKKEEEFKEILICYEIFLPKKKEELNGKIKIENLEEYSDAKDMNSFIFNLIGEKIEKTENNISLAKEKWKNIKSLIKNKEYDNIDKSDRLKIINFFKDKKNLENTIIKQLSISNYIEAFIDNKNESKKQDKQQDLSLKKENNSSKEMRERNKKKNYENMNSSKIQKITMLLSYKNENLNIEKLWKNNILYPKDKINLLKDDDKMNNIFDYIDKIEEILKKCNFKFPKIFKLIIEIKEQKFLYKYEFFNSKDKNISETFEEEHPSDNKSSDELEKKLSEIFEKNDINNNNINNNINNNNQNKIFISIADIILGKRKIEEDSKQENKTENRNNASVQLERNKIEQTDANNNDTQTTLFLTNVVEYKEDNKYKVLEFIKIIGNHNERNRMFTPECIYQSKYSFLSSGTNNEIKIYNMNFDEYKGLITEELKEWIYSLYERDINKNNESEFIVCSFKEISLLRISNKQFVDNKKWNVPNMTCLACAEVKIKEMPKQQQHQPKKKKNKNPKENKEHISEYLIIAGRNGIKYIVDVFKDKNKNDKELNLDLNNFYIDRDNSFRSVFKLSETRIAFTSNAIIPDGKNKLIIYNFNKSNDKDKIIDNSKKRGGIEYPKKIEEETENENYSFIASNNGMASYNENILLCACKKYTKKDKNGILLLIIKEDKNKDKNEVDNKNNNDKNNELKVEKIFYHTEDFEVYCFCNIIEKKTDGIQDDVNVRTEPFVKTDFFFVGGFDKNLREGKIKLFKYEKSYKNEIIGIKFLQDVEIEEKKETENGIKPKKFEGFGGAINSIVQHYCKLNIIVSCYDGKIYQLSKPNLKPYTANNVN